MTERSTGSLTVENTYNKNGTIKTSTVYVDNKKETKNYTYSVNSNGGAVQIMTDSDGNTVKTICKVKDNKTCEYIQETIV